MKISKILLAVAVSANLFAAAAFAAPTSKLQTPNATEQKSGELTREKCTHFRHEKNHEEFLKDPVKALQSKKQKVLELEQEGKISKEEADKITRKIDARIKDVQEFNKLTVEQKREKLIDKFKDVMALKVKEGKLTKESADQMVAEYTKKLQNWDGNGFPGFMHKVHIQNCH